MHHVEQRKDERAPPPFSEDLTEAVKPYPQHSALDDAYGMFIGIALAATGIAILGKSGLITGGIAGMALLVSFITQYTPSVLVPVINIPFLLFALVSMGRSFTLKSVIVSLALGLGISLVSPVLNLSGIHAGIGSILGGTFLGMGILCLARHNASVGGTGAVVLWVQRRFSINAGVSQLACDCALFLVAAIYLPLEKLAWSFVGTLAMNFILISWHKPGRYRG
ncbi:YitT family protein [Pseudomonas sp. M47T1]|uniref:YitT family protein n=1 Tax=Pseudomonas sp. M47T1 TaxID=1179778 RepID=UPI0012F8A3C5|nr:YitT family protein [Pseudomonas sp. M47T1]